MSGTEAERLIEAMVAAYGPVAQAGLERLGVQEPPDAWHETLAQGEAWLAAALTELLSQPYARQRRGPLELFQEAMRFPNEMLSSAGVAPPTRSEVTATALPGDRYDLAPASSRDLGEPAWRAHLAWGAAKAAGVAGSVGSATVLWYGRDLSDRARVEEAAMRAGRRVVAVATLAGLEEELAGARPSRAVVDLGRDGALEAIGRMAAAGMAVVAYGPHVDVEGLEEAERRGATLALPRSRFFLRVDDLIAGRG